jgi:hypothetical protein
MHKTKNEEMQELSTEKKRRETSIKFKPTPPFFFNEILSIVNTLNSHNHNIYSNGRIPDVMEEYI